MELRSFPPSHMEVRPVVSTVHPTNNRRGQHSVLIIDQSEDNREVLKTVLQRHGVQTLEATRGDDGLRLAKQCQPDVVVLDLDTLRAEDGLVYDGISEDLPAAATAVVLLGTIPAESPLGRSSETISKPYHYRPLIRKIEELLQHAAEPGETPRR